MRDQNSAAFLKEKKLCIETIAGYLDIQQSADWSQRCLFLGSMVLSEWMCAGTSLVAAEDLRGIMTKSNASLEIKQHGTTCL